MTAGGRISLLALYTGRTARDAACLGALFFVQRLLPPALVLAFDGGSVLVTRVLGVTVAALVLLQSYAGRIFQGVAEADLCGRAGSAVVHGDVLASSQRPAGSLSELGQGIYHVAQLAAVTVPTLAADACAAVVLACLLAVREPPAVVLAGGAVAAVGGAVLFVTRGASERASARAWEAQTRTYRALHDMVEGRLEVAASGQRGAFVAGLRFRAQEWAREAVHVATRQALAGRLPLAVIGALLAVVLWESRAWGLSAGLTIGDAALFLSALPPFAGLAQGAHALTRSRRWVALVDGVLAEGRERAGGARPHRATPTRIALEGVSFRYAGVAADVLHAVDISFHGPGTFALAGPNGCGKSTCLRLLLGLATPHAGRVVVDGEPLAGTDLDAWRARVAFVPQRPYLPPGADVRTAVRWLVPGASDERILGALDRAMLLEVLERAPGSPLDVVVDTLSVGQRQRVAFARALCSDASVYLLDEPDANLDASGIDCVAEVVRDLGRESLVIVAAHTPELLRAVDRVVRLDAEGTIVLEPAVLGAESYARD